jgi:hypothetical protein
MPAGWRRMTRGFVAKKANINFEGRRFLSLCAGGCVEKINNPRPQLGAVVRAVD